MVEETVHGRMKKKKNINNKIEFQTTLGDDVGAFNQNWLTMWSVIPYRHDIEKLNVIEKTE